VSSCVVIRCKNRIIVDCSFVLVFGELGAGDSHFNDAVALFWRLVLMGGILGLLGVVFIGAMCVSIVLFEKRFFSYLLQHFLRRLLV